MEQSQDGIPSEDNFSEGSDIPRRTRPFRGRGVYSRRPQWRNRPLNRYRHVSDASVRDFDELSLNLKNLFLGGDDSDITIMVQDKKYPAHKNVLKARSPVFSEMLSLDTIEKNHGVIEIPDCDPLIFRDFLIFLYAGKLDGITAENAFELFRVSDKYGVKSLLRQCVRFVAQNLTSETLGEVLFLSIKHEEASLLSKATNFFAKNAESVLSTEKWESFIRDKPLEANNLFMKVLEDRTGKKDCKSESGSSETMSPRKGSGSNQTDCSTDSETQIVDSKEEIEADVCCNPEQKSLEILCTNLRRLCFDYEDSDITFKVRNVFYPGHRNILRVRSTVLSKMLTIGNIDVPQSSHNDKVIDNKMIEIPDCEPLIFHDFLLYLYSGKLDSLTQANVFELFKMAKAYDVQCLQEICVHFLTRNLSPDILGDVLSLAVKNDVEGLLDLAEKCFVENAAFVLQRKEWMKFVKKYPLKANKLFVKVLKQCPVPECDVTDSDWSVKAERGSVY